MEKNKETLENYKIRENEEPRLLGGIMGLFAGMLSGVVLADTILHSASKMSNCMQTNVDFNFYKDIGQFYNTGDALETMVCVAGIMAGGAILTRSLFGPKYEIYKENL